MASKGQEKILETLDEKPRTVMELIEVTYLSDSFIRNTIRIMEQTGQVEKIDTRVPYVYRIALNSPRMRLKEKIQQAKQDLIAETPFNPLTKFLREKEKEKWPVWADTMEAIALAVRELESEGKLIETL